MANFAIFAGQASFRPAVVDVSNLIKEEGPIKTTQIKEVGDKVSIVVVLTTMRDEAKLYYWENNKTRVSVLSEQLLRLEKQTNEKLLNEVRNAIGAYVVNYSVKAPTGYLFVKVAIRDSDDWYGNNGNKIITQAAKRGEIMRDGDGKTLTKKLIKDNLLVPESELVNLKTNSFGMFDIKEAKINKDTNLAMLCEVDAIEKFGIKGKQYQLLSIEEVEALDADAISAHEVLPPAPENVFTKTGTISPFTFPSFGGGPGTIMFTVVSDAFHSRIQSLATARQLVVDWGDGSAPETYPNLLASDANCDFDISHTYASHATYTIQIKVEGLTYLNCASEKLTSLDIHGCTTLQTLECWGNRLTSLNVSNCTALQTLECSRNQLTSLDVRGCKELQTLTCWGNRLTSLDVRGCKELQTLECNENRLTSLDLDGCQKLQVVNCSFNNLSELDARGCSALGVVHCTVDTKVAILVKSDCSVCVSSMSYWERKERYEMKYPKKPRAEPWDPDTDPDVQWYRQWMKEETGIAYDPWEKEDKNAWAWENEELMDEFYAIREL